MSCENEAHQARGKRRERVTCVKLGSGGALFDREDGQGTVMPRARGTGLELRFGSAAAAGSLQTCGASRPNWKVRRERR